MAKFSKRRLVFGLYLVVLVAAAELVSGRLHVAAWPAFVALVLFFLERMDPRRIAEILLGALLGIALLLLAPGAIGLLAHLVGAQWAQLAYILIAVYLIVALHDLLPMFFNSHAFMFLTVGALALGAPAPNPWQWALVALAGG
ncbi:MAG TPA: hypothetical protein VL994_10760, partial [Steroidobacteraceae bacterium]|nr:hypothetical protein [Steroidobacteraceae bacterium]